MQKNLLTPECPILLFSSESSRRKQGTSKVLLFLFLVVSLGSRAGVELCCTQVTALVTVG